MVRPGGVHCVARWLSVGHAVVREREDGQGRVPRSLCVRIGPLGLHSLRETFVSAWRVVSRGEG